MDRDSFLNTFYNGLIYVGESFQSILLLAIRLFWGYGFAQGGLGKFRDIPSTTSFFEGLGIPFAQLTV